MRVVLILLPNCIYYPIIFLGVLCLGGVATTMNPSSTVFEIEKEIADCNACFTFTDTKKLGKLRGLRVPAIGVLENVHFDSKLLFFCFCLSFLL